MIVFVKQIPEEEGNLLVDLASADEERNRIETFVNEQVKNNCLKVEAVEKYVRMSADARVKVRQFNSRILKLIPYQITVSNLKWDWGTDTAHNLVKVLILDDNINKQGIEILVNAGFEMIDSLTNPVIIKPPVKPEIETTE